MSLEKLRPEHPAEVKRRFCSARGGGPGLGRTDRRSWEGRRGTPAVVSVLSLFDPWEVPHVAFLCPPPPPAMALNQDSSLGGKRAQPSLQEGSWPHRSRFTSQWSRECLEVLVWGQEPRGAGRASSFLPGGPDGVWIDPRVRAPGAHTAPPLPRPWAC